MPRTFTFRNVFCVAIMLAGLAIVGIAVWESVQYQQAVDGMKLFIGVLIAVGGGVGVDPKSAHAFVGEAVTLGNALPAGIIGALRGGRRQSDPVVVPQPADAKAPVIVATHDPEKY